jgi:metallophosphoesterase (TIGR00282 family)
MIKILFFGDIVGRSGRTALEKILPELKEKYHPDVTIANVENIAHGKGITVDTISFIKNAGVDFMTSGNHVFDITEGVSILEDPQSMVLRPANYPPQVPGKGFETISIGAYKFLVINLVGRVFMHEDFDDPFRKADEILTQFENDKSLGGILVDFHAEATSEKIAFAKYLDGKVSAVIGTHTHVMTDDAQISKLHTASITDVGMCGAQNSVIGVETELVLQRFLTQINKPLEVAEGPAIINGLYLEIDPKNRETKKIKKIKEIVS